MRPIRLELNGFASFREPTVLDFTDVDLFVLSGPTGAGKSSVIDAMTMCLYGSVPRYDDKRLVHPVISQGQLEARVRLDFAVDGQTYTAVRVVRRTKTGATTKEARLERDGRTLAASADELTRTVEALLGLSFEHFTRTVVLPQGDFQRFLHAKPSDRQDLLVELLDLDVYRRVASAARSDEAAARGAIDGMRSRLDGDLAAATEEAVADARGRAAALETLVGQLDAAKPELDAIHERGKQAARDEAEAKQRRDAVKALTAPEDLDALTAQLATATQQLEEVTAAADRADRELVQLEEARAARPATAVVQQVATRFEALEHTRSLVPQRERAETEARGAAEQAEQRRAQTAEAQQRAQARLDELRRQHAAHTLASGLAAGDPCPVCDRELDAAPDPTAPDDLSAAEEALRTATATLQQHEQTAREAAQAATRAQTQLEATVAAVDERAAELATARGDLTLPDDLAALNALVEQLAQEDAAIATAQRTTREARAKVGAAREALDALGEQQTRAREQFDRARDSVATLDPPSPSRDDIGAAWAALLAWAERTTPEVEEQATGAEQAITAARQEYGKRMAELLDLAADAGVTVERPATFDALRDACVQAASEASQRAANLAARQQEAVEVRQRLEETERRAALSKALGQHLDARRFEKWLLNRALARLLDGASDILRELSNGAYSLTLGDDNNFLVIDHRNADEERSARTLSGGETFLASLSLALSLAEDVAALAAHGSARLEALFLDEGFGTLDADTLDTVAAAIEELGARGRMVGLITHVRELSERIPVRYEVRKGPGGSQVEKVVA